MSLTISGKFIPLDTSDKNYAYLRVDSTISQTLLVILNLARGKDGRGEETTFTVPGDVDVSKAKLIIANKEGLEGSGIEGKEVGLGKYEGRIYLL